MPRTSSALGSPVPKYIICGFFGSCTIPPTAKFCKKSLIGFQIGRVAVISVVFHKPPEQCPTNKVFLVGSLASTSSVPTLPPTLVGPRSFHLALDSVAPLLSKFVRNSSSWRFLTKSKAGPNRSFGTYPKEAARPIAGHHTPPLRDRLSAARTTWHRSSATVSPPRSAPSRRAPPRVARGPEHTKPPVRGPHRPSRRAQVCKSHR